MIVFSSDGKSGVVKFFSFPKDDTALYLGVDHLGLTDYHPLVRDRRARESDRLPDHLHPTVRHLPRLQALVVFSRVGWRGSMIGLR